MVPMSPPESFGIESLSEKIDGKAELYLSAGFRSLSCQRFKKADDPELWLEVFVYDMGNIENAFSVYSVQKREGFIPIKLSGYSYKTENALFFVSGRHYVEITSSKVSGFLMDSMILFGKEFIGKTGGETFLPDTRLFPRDDLDEESIVLYPSNAFSFERFNMVYAADYKTRKGKVKVFFSRRKNNAEAEELAESYPAFLSSFGGKKIKSDPGSENIKIIEIMDAYELVFANGPFLGGVHEAGDLKTAEALAAGLNEILGEKTGGGN
jgi:hypothetical protein